MSFEVVYKKIFIQLEMYLSLLGLRQVLGELAVRSLAQGKIGPKIGSEVAISLADGLEGSLDEVTESLGVSERGSVDVLDSSVLEELLGSARSDDSGTARSGDEANRDGAALAGDLGGDGVRGTDLVSPVALADRDKRQLGNGNGTTDGSGDFSSALDTKTKVSVAVTNNDEGLEAGSLTSSGLLLDGHDLDDLILNGGEEVVNDLGLLDGEGVAVDLLQVGDEAVLHKATKLGNGNPGSSLGLGATSTLGATASTATTASTSETTSTRLSTDTVTHSKNDQTTFPSNVNTYLPSDKKKGCKLAHES
jgi:hypothetical protein